MLDCVPGASGRLQGDPLRILLNPEKRAVSPTVSSISMDTSRGLKLAVTGKGGVGKTTLASLLCHLFAAEGRRVIAVDADPDANLAGALGIPPEKAAAVRPLAEMADLIEERTGARPGSQGGMFRLNPRVDDVPEGQGLRHDNITLLVMGKSREASAGCYCPENIFLRRLLRHLIVERDEVVVVDMEAGIEHLTRGTADSVDAFLVVVEPGKRSLQTARTVRGLAAGLGIGKVFVVANKVRSDEDFAFIRGELEEMAIIGRLPFDPEVMEADIRGLPPHRLSEKARQGAAAVVEAIGKRM